MRVKFQFNLCVLASLASTAVVTQTARADFNLLSPTSPVSPVNPTNMTIRNESRLVMPWLPSLMPKPSLPNSVGVVIDKMNKSGSCSNRFDVVGVYDRIRKDERAIGGSGTHTALTSAAIFSGKSPSEVLSVYQAIRNDGRAVGGSDTHAALTSAAIFSGKSPSEVLSVYQTIRNDGRAVGGSDALATLTDTVIACSRSKMEEKKAPLQLPLEAQSSKSNKSSVPASIGSASQVKQDSGNESAR